MEKATSDAKKMIEEYEGLAASVSAAASSKSRARTLHLTAKKTKKAGSKKKVKGNVVKLDPTALSAIDEVASVSSSFQSFDEEEEDEDDDEAEDAEVDAREQIVPLGVRVDG
eukprot:1840444-Amphidinium_carterae.3